jgi:PRTRC genetic system protein B
VPVSVDVSLGRQSKVELAKAVLLYQEGRHQGDAFATVHEVTGVEEGQPALAPGQLLTVEGLREIHKALYRVQRLEVLPLHVLVASPERLVWFEPARSRVMFFTAADAYLNSLSGQSFPQPPLVFIAGERSLKVFALGEDERPTGSSPVFTAPYYNTDHRGVCIGSMPLPTALSVHDTVSYSDAFFHSAFTHGTSERLLKGWGGSYGEAWAYVKQQGTFPTQHLVPQEKTVEDVINA